MADVFVKVQNKNRKPNVVDGLRFQIYVEVRPYSRTSFSYVRSVVYHFNIAMQRYE